MLTGHFSPFPTSSLSFSPEGDRVAMGSGYIALIWDTTTGNLLATLRGHAEYVNHVLFSPNGERMLTTSGEIAHIWDVHWLTAYRGQGLIAAFCETKLVGARKLTEADVTASPLLKNRAGEDVCEPPSLLTTVRSFLIRMLPETTRETAP
jgi:WD40 repeat protein